MKKHIDVEVEEESVLLKTIKLTKNINYLTERLPKPNYNPLRYKSMLNNRKGDKKEKLHLNIKLSLPPLKNNKELIKSERKVKMLREKSS